MTQKLTPYPHQLDAVNAITKELQVSNRTTAVMACGSGKTLVALWVAEQMNANNILVLLPSLALIAQTLKEWKKHTMWRDFNVLCICSDNTVTNTDDIKLSKDEIDFSVTTDKAVVTKFLNSLRYRKIVFSTYQSCDLIPSSFKFDLGIFDEAHKTAGHENGLFSYALSNKNINITKRLFMTATPRHVDVNKQQTAYSMDNEPIYGKVCYKLSFSDAVKRDIICGYKIIISVLTSDDINRDLIHHGIINIKKAKVHAKNIANTLALDNAIKENDIKKAFTFHKTVKDAKTFSIVSNSLILSKNFKFMHISGEMNSVERGAILSDFRQSPAAVLSNARCLTEGVDVPAVDLVAFMSPKKSQIDVIQAAGRAMRKYNGKVQGYVLIPIFLETNNQENFEEALNDTQYNDIWNILQALQEYDDELSNIMTDLRKNRVHKDIKEDVRIRERLNKKINILGIGSSLHLNTLRSAIVTKVVDKLTSTWDERFEELLIYKEKHGHTLVPQRYEKSLSLGSWVSDQRDNFRNNILSKERIDKLNSIGFIWDPWSCSWNKKFEELLKFREKHGDVDVPTTITKKDSLGLWVSIQRRDFRLGRICQERIDKLNSLGFLWNPEKDRWEEKFQELLKFKKEYGHTFVTGNKFKKLAIWTSRQRGELRTNTLSKERIDRLNSINFIWDTSNILWEKKFLSIVRLKKKLGYKSISEQNFRNKSTKSWITRQRILFKNNKLSQERIDKLNSIGFLWKIKDK